MPAKPLPPVDYLRQRLRLDPETGRLYWRDWPGADHRWRARFVGKEAFTCERPDGYREGRIDRTAYRAHRVVWALYHGEDPAGQIDHIDHDRQNNCIKNLRVVTHAENHKNTSPKKNNTSGRTGITHRRTEGKWVARITVGYKEKHLGYFSRFEDAVAAREAAEVAFAFHQNHGKDALTVEG